MLGLEDNIEFGKEFTHFVCSPSATLSSSSGEPDNATSTPIVTAHFRDGSTAQGTLLVGADGMRSLVRRQYLPDHIPVDTDASCIYGKTPISTQLTESFPADAMRWMTIIADSTPLTLFLEPVRFANDPAAVSQGRLPSVSDYIYWVLLSRSSTFGLTDKHLLGLSGPEAAQLSLKLTEQWSPEICSLLRLHHADQAAALRIASATPSLPVWTPCESVTLLGDAIHVMSPTGGSGANTALRDAANLCATIVGAGERRVTQLDVGRYEEGMRQYARSAIKGSYLGGKNFGVNQLPIEQCQPLQFN